MYKFDLTVCLKFSVATPALKTARRELLAEFFQHVSEVLFYATQGRNQLGAVILCDDSTGSDQADAVIGEDAQTHSTGKRFWTKQQNGGFLYSKEHLPSVASFIHELGHYLYDLLDEYQGPGAGGCTDPATHPVNKNADGTEFECISIPQRRAESACLMDRFDANLAAGWMLWTNATNPDDRGMYGSLSDLLDQRFLPVSDPDHVDPHYTTGGYFEGVPSQFCWAGNHSTQRNYQNVCHSGQSCWETMVVEVKHPDVQYGLTVPSAQPDPSTIATVPDTVTVVDALPTETYAVVVDDSGSVEGGDMERLHDGLGFLIDNVDQTEQVTVVTYADSATVESPLSTVPLDTDPAQAAWRAERVAIVTSLAAGGSADIGGGLRAALREIQTQPRAASQSVVLFSGGFGSFGADSAERLLSDLLGAGLRLHVVGVGNERDPLLLQQLAVRTGGRYFGIGSSPAAPLTSSQIQTFMTLTAATARDDTSVTALHSAPAPTPGPDHWPPPDPGAGSFTPHRIDAPVWIGTGSTRCTIGAMSPRDLSHLQFRLLDPTGREVAANDRDVRPVRWQNGHVLWSIQRPSPGNWSVVVTGDIPPDHRLKVFGFETNPKVSVEVDLPQDRVEPGKSFQLRVRLRAPLPIRATQVSARFAGSATSFPSRPLGDVDRYGDLVAEHMLEVPVADGVLGPQTILVDVVREAGDAIYPRDRICGDDRRPLDGRETRSVRVEKIVRRFVGTVIVGTPTRGPGADSQSGAGSPLRRVGDILVAPIRRLFGLKPPPREMRSGVRPQPAWVHPQQQKLVGAWKQKYRPR